MKRDLLETVISENLNKIQVGQVFATQRKLFEELNIPSDGNGDKNTKRVVKDYVKWELTGAPNKEGKKSKEIRITEIIPNPQYIDGRKDNGGAHNDVFGPILKPALLQYDYPTYITYSQIYEDVYGFKKGFFSNMRKPDFSKNHTKHEIEYRKLCEDYLKARTKTALASLQKEGLLTYEPIYLINKSIWSSKGLDVLDCIRDIEINDKTLLKDMVEAVWCPIKGENSFKDFEAIVRSCGIVTDENIAQMTVFQFTEIALKKKCTVNKSLIDQFYEFPESAEPSFSNKQQYQFIEMLKARMCEVLNMKLNEVHLNSKKEKKFYDSLGVIYNLLGWESVWSGLHIQIKDTNPVGEDYSYKKLLETLEPRIKEQVFKIHYNTYKQEKKKREKKPKRHFGTYSDIIVGTDEDVHYLADDYKVNREHCKLFNLPVCNDYLKK